MDPALAEAFAEILEEVWSQPWLGNATTGQLLDEIRARVNCAYKTVGGEFILDPATSIKPAPLKAMEPYQQRVVTEKAELDDKLSRLRPFITSDKFKTLSAAEQERMGRQLGLMEKYSEVLAERIAAF